MLGGVERKHHGSGCAPTRAARQLHLAARPYAGRPWRMSLASVLCGGMAAFVLGGTFWIVLALQELTGSASPNISPVPEPQSLHAPGCTSLAIDRRMGRTTAEPCASQLQPLREALATGLGDRALR
jgi:hypothetical protein